MTGVIVFAVVLGLIQLYDIARALYLILHALQTLAARQGGGMSTGWPQ